MYTLGSGTDFSGSCSCFVIPGLPFLFDELSDDNHIMKDSVRRHTALLQLHNESFNCST